MVSRERALRQPVRTCVGCRGRAPVADLLRVVAMEAGGEIILVPDPRRRLPGRGASLHPDLACLALAEKRRAFGRALRVTGVLDCDPLRATLADVPTDGGATTAEQQNQR